MIGQTVTEHALVNITYIHCQNELVIAADIRASSLLLKAAGKAALTTGLKLDGLPLLEGLRTGAQVIFVLVYRQQKPTSSGEVECAVGLVHCN